MQQDEEDHIELRAVMDALGVIGGKWKFPVIFSLCKGKKRFNELEADLKSISPRALSNALKDLEQNGLISRAVFPTVPVTVEYSLTAYGLELQPVLKAIQAWGKKHREKIFRGE